VIQLPVIRACGRDWHRGRKYARGVTFVELLVTLAVVSILLAIGVPSFNDAVLSSRLTSIANDLLASIQLARSEAVKRNVPVTICRSLNGTSCTTTGDWEQGWIVKDDTTVIQHQPTLQAGYKVIRTVGGGTLEFQPIGVGATAGKFTVCRSEPAGRQKRVVTISATGMAYVTRTQSGSC
jgi:type IV fimbrial biogenesis protein FimT